MDSARTELLRELLAADPLIAQTDEFARTLQRSSSTVGGLMLVGTPNHDPWHLTAHLSDEARFAGTPELEPMLVRWAPPADAPPHLAIGIERLERAQRGETVVVVAQDPTTDPLLERADDARGRGATVLAVADASDQVASVAHETLIVPRRSLWTPARTALPDGVTDALGAFDPDDADLTFDTTQHLLSLSVGQAAREPQSARGVRRRLGRLIDQLTGAPQRW
jgi:hypothetical protein